MITNIQHVVNVLRFTFKLILINLIERLTTMDKGNIGQIDTSTVPGDVELSAAERAMVGAACLDLIHRLGCLISERRIPAMFEAADELYRMVEAEVDADPLPFGYEIGSEKLSLEREH